MATVEQSDGRHVEINRIGAGELFGEMALLDHAPRSATVLAATPATVYELHADGFAMLRAQSAPAASALATLVIRDVTRRLRRLDEWIETELNRLGQAEPNRSPTRSLPRPPDGKSS